MVREIKGCGLSVARKMNSVHRTSILLLCYVAKRCVVGGPIFCGAERESPAERVTSSV